MTIAPGVPVVFKDGTQTPVFLHEQRKIENGVIVVTTATLPKPVKGWTRYLEDENRPVWGDGSVWRYADGTEI